MEEMIMLAMAFRFPAGRYHATPWGRHVNEADVEWPPSPWRIVRALVANWHRKIDPIQYPFGLLENLLGKLSECLPVYRLPSVMHSHARHYMPVRESNKDKSSLIFDAFARISPEDELIVAWPYLELKDEEERLLEQLLAGIAYLGRAESWVEGRRLSQWQGHPNCFPADFKPAPEKGETEEMIPLLCPLAPTAYYKLYAQGVDHGVGSKIAAKKKAGRPKAFLPESWLEAVSLETSVLQAAGWSHPPASQRIWYRRPTRSLAPTARSLTPSRHRIASKVTTLRFAFYGRPLPLLENAVRIGELARMALMRVVENKQGKVPPLLSGHGLPRDNRHEHAFFLPEPDQDGQIGHLLVHVSGGLDQETLRAMQGLKKLYMRNGPEWEVWFEGAGLIEDFSETSPFMASGKIWRPVTPYLRPWHVKKNFDTFEQIKKECLLHALPAPEAIHFLSEIKVGSRIRRPVHFHRFRSKRGLLQPDTHGCLPELVFPETIQGPLALGFGSHYGLGLFVPVEGTV
jgi:CRISPR-associated protein Csb2